jgi:diadenosine tetraphosphate (Ap4A) HIT family hydrolase
MFNNTLSLDGGAAVETGCEFCDEFSGGHDNAFATRYHGEISDRYALETAHFKVLPSLGQIVPGYLLFVPSSHYRALADLPAELLTEIDELRTIAENRLRTAYGSYLYFEHGARSDSAGGCGIYHAHLHAVPFRHADDPVRRLKEAFSYDEIDGLKRLREQAPERSYLYYQDVCGNQYVFRTEHLASQFMRRVLAEALGSDAWDWRHCGREADFTKTVAKTSSLLRAASMSG